MYEHLIPEETGKVWALEDDIAKSQKMRQFLQKQFGTSTVENIDLAELKAVLEGEPLMQRTKYRKMVAIGKSKPIIKKGEKYRQEHNLASDYDKAVKHPDYGFTCLHMSVSESIGNAKVTIINKNKHAGSIGVRTKDDTAVAGDDYHKVDKEIKFKHGDKDDSIQIAIVDDNGWEPDEDFLVELYDLNTGNKLSGRDTECRITILDDDKPGQIAFANPNVRHAATFNECAIVVKRIHESDGQVSVRYKTIEIDQGERTARATVDFEKKEGELIFEHNETEKEIVVKILDKELAEGEERDEIFGLKLFDPTNGVKLSKRDVCHIELVKDAKSARQA